MYGVKFSLWLTGAVGPQAVAGRHSSTRPLASGRLGAGIDVHRHDRISASIDVSLTTAILAPTEVLENSKTWISIINCSLMLWIDLWCFSLISAGVEKIGIPLNKGRVASLKMVPSKIYFPGLFSRLETLSPSSQCCPLVVKSSTNLSTRDSLCLHGVNGGHLLLHRFLLLKQLEVCLLFFFFHLI